MDVSTRGSDMQHPGVPDPQIWGLDTEKWKTVDGRTQIATWTHCCCCCCWRVRWHSVGG